MIVGISAASAAGVAGAVFAAIFFYKRTNLIDHQNVYIKMKKNDDVSKTMENPLPKMMGDNDDPFEDDFDLDELS